MRHLACRWTDNPGREGGPPTFFPDISQD